MVSRKVIMAEKRMFALKIIDSDAFLDMSTSAQNLYFHLAMRADDDGFISAPKKIMRIIGASIDDLRLLAEKRFILTFDTGIVVIKHWRIHNYIAKDRYTPTVYKEEKEKLFIKSNGAYTDHERGDDGSMYTPCIQVDNKAYTNRIQKINKPSTGSAQNDDTDKIRLDKIRLDKINIQPAASVVTNVTTNVDTKVTTNEHHEKTTDAPVDKIKHTEEYKEVEGHYTEQWAILYTEKKVVTDKPAIDFKVTRTLLKGLFESGFTVEQINGVVDKAMRDGFIQQNGYSLKTILSAGMFNKLLNGSEPEKEWDVSKQGLLGRHEGKKRDWSEYYAPDPDAQDCTY